MWPHVFHSPPWPQSWYRCVSPCLAFPELRCQLMDQPQLTETFSYIVTECSTVKTEGLLKRAITQDIYTSIPSLNWWSLKQLCSPKYVSYFKPLNLCQKKYIITSWHVHTVCAVKTMEWRTETTLFHSSFPRLRCCPWQRQPTSSFTASVTEAENMSLFVRQRTRKEGCWSSDITFAAAWE